MREKVLVLMVLVLLTAGCVSQPEVNETNNTEYKLVDPEIEADTSFHSPDIFPGDNFNEETVPFSMTFDENVVIKEFTLDNKAMALETEDHLTFTFTKKLSDGNHAIKAIATDIAGNKLTVEHSFYVDSKGPEVMKVEPYDTQIMPTNHASILIKFTEEVDIISSQLDTTIISLVTSDNEAFTLLVEDLEYGERYTLRITAEDQGGNSITHSSSFSIRDIMAPERIDNLELTNTGTGTSMRLDWDQCDDSAFSQYNIYSNDNGEFSSIVGMDIEMSRSPVESNNAVISDLKENKNYCFAVTCVDDSDNEDSVVDSVCLKTSFVDTKPPEVIDESPYTWTNSSAVNIFLRTDESATCKYSIDTRGGWEYQEYTKLNYSMSKSGGNTNHTATSPSLDNGDNIFFVRCKDTDGNIMDPPHSWNVDVAYTP